MGTRALKRGLAVAALAAAILVPAASAKSTPRIKLSLIPLPKSALGPAARGLTLAQDSGVLANSDVGAGFKKLGRMTGYLLDYGDPYRGGTGVTAIETDINKYRTARGAKRGLVLGRKGDLAGVATLQKAGLAFTGKALARPAVGGRSFAFLWTSSITGVDPVSSVDVQWTEGRFVLQVQVAAGSQAAAESLARKLARRLDKRLRLALAGRLHGKPVKLPSKVGPYPPPGVPSLAALALQASDLGSPTNIVSQSYAFDPPAISEFEVDMQPAGVFADLTQVIDWWPSANEATFYSSVEYTLSTRDLSDFLGVPGVTSQLTPVDVTSVGDAAQAASLEFDPSSGGAVYLAVVALRSGQAADFVLVAGDSPIQSSDVQNLAEAMATRLDTGLAA